MKNTDIIKDGFYSKCTGCGACKNACPTNAIELCEGNDGFLYPIIDGAKCVNCKKCQAACPVSNLKKKNDLNSKMYAVRADDNKRAVSSSGGIFSVVAESILEKGGYVCGARFDENMKLRHKIISDVKDLAPLRGSKYLQSNIGNAYKEIEVLLKQKKTVLFVGTPCQVAGLKNVLSKDYDTLYTIDIFCHGVPSQKSFDLYLRDISGGKKVINVDFRNKRFGWNCENILVKFADGSEYAKSRQRGDAYVKAFLENMNLRESCENCKFSEAPRHGDISIGDFWGIERVDKTQNDGKGTSILLINTKRGNDLLKIIQNSSIVSEYKYENDLPNRIHSKIPAHPMRHKFFELIDKNGFTGTVREIARMSASKPPVLNKKYDVGLVCNYGACNFGGSLTQYALYNVLEDMGYSTIMIERPLNAPETIHRDLQTLIYKKWPFTSCAPQFKTKEEMRKLNDICDSFVVGSDVLFRHSLYNLMGKISTLDWVDNTKRKIAYAASYGYDYIVNNEPKDTAEMACFMQQFDAFSTREKSGVELFKNEFGVDATWVLDPVFLCDKKHYEPIIANAGKEPKKKYICSYMLDPTEDKAKILSHFGAKLNKSVEVFSEFSRNKDNLPGKQFFEKFDHVNYTVEERLQSIKNCDFMVADSFHGICFAIIFNRPFVCIVNKARGATRFESLLGHFGLKDRMVESFDDVLKRPELLNDIDYGPVNEIINEEIIRCKKWLSDALTCERRKGYSLYDILSRLIKQKDEEIDILRRQLSVLYSQINGLSKINNVDDYMNELNRVKDHSTIIVSVKDTPGIELSLEYGEKIKNCLGANINLAKNHQKSYIFISHNGRNIFESLEDGVIRKRVSFEGFDINVTSASLKCGNIADIFINGKNYSTSSRGLNIVVIDNLSGTIVDSVCLDTHLVPYSFSRNQKERF